MTSKNGQFSPFLFFAALTIHKQREHKKVFLRRHHIIIGGAERTKNTQGWETEGRREAFLIAKEKDRIIKEK